MIKMEFIYDDDNSDKDDNKKLKRMIDQGLINRIYDMRMHDDLRSVYPRAVIIQLKDILGVFYVDNMNIILENKIFTNEIEHLECDDLNLEQIPFFPNLKTLICSNNYLTSIPEYPLLEQLHCSNNQLTNLNNYRYLTHLSCSFNKLTSIPLYSNLTDLHCDNNKLNIIYDYPKLRLLSCNDNPIQFISGCYHLETLYCMRTKLKSIHNYPLLEILNCSHTMISKLPIFPKIRILDCFHGILKEIPEYLKLVSLNCAHNQITKIGKLPKIKRLICWDNLLEKFSNRQFLYLEDLECSENQLESLPNMPNLVTLHCSFNNLDYIHSTSKLMILDCSYNERITKLPSFNNLKSLKCQECSLTEIPYLPSLEILDCNHNQITRLSHLTKLKKLNCSGNLLTNLPDLPEINELNFSYNEISTLPDLHLYRHLDVLIYHHNPINFETLEPRIREVLDLFQANQNHDEDDDLNEIRIYDDNQNVHDSNINKSIIESVKKLMETPNTIDYIDMVNEIYEEQNLQLSTKELINDFCYIHTKHSILDITYKDLFIKVWNVIRTHEHKKEILKVLEQEIIDSETMCFIGKINRLVNCLNGFDPRINIKINENEQIANIIILIKHQLEEANNYNVDKHRILVIKELLERDISIDTIEIWIKSIE